MIKIYKPFTFLLTWLFLGTNSLLFGAVCLQGKPAGESGEILSNKLFILPGVLNTHNGNSYLPDLELDNPLSITKGGVYENLVINSKKYNVPAVKIQTSEPVIIRNCVISGSGDLIVNTSGNAKIKICNNYLWGRNPNMAGSQQGRSVKVENVDYFIFCNNYTEQTGGIRIKTLTGHSDTTVWIQGNIHKDLTSLVSNGTGKPGREGYDLAQDQGGEWNRQMVMLNSVKTPEGSIAPRIVYNILENNEYNPDNVSSTEDLINVFGSKGENMGNPIIIARNFLRGAHGNEPFNNYRAFYGTAIILDASQESGADFGYVMIFENYGTYIQNAGIAISSGHDCEVFDNKIINPLIGEDGKIIRGSYDSGGYLWAWKAENPVANTHYHNNTIYAYSTKNKEPGKYSKNTFWGPDCFVNNNSCHDNKSLSDTIKHDFVLKLYCEFFKGLEQEGISLGPDWGPAATLLDVKVADCVDIMDNTDLAETCDCSNSLANIYPNPVQEMLTIEFETGRFNQLVLINNSGQIMYSTPLGLIENSRSLSVGNFPQGMYHVVLRGDQGIVTRKFVK